MNRKIKLAEYIEEAINKLSTGNYTYSCSAVRAALEGSSYDLFKEFDEFVLYCGLNQNFMYEFTEFKRGEERQQARAIWLTMLYLIRKDYEDGVIDL